MIIYCDARAPAPSTAFDRSVDCPIPTDVANCSAVHFSCAPRVRGACSPLVDVRTWRDNTAARVSNIRPAIDVFSINAVSTLGRSNLTSTLACFSFGVRRRVARTARFISLDLLNFCVRTCCGPWDKSPSLKCRAPATALNLGRPYGGRRTGE
jgi:hypothetical protein